MSARPSTVLPALLAAPPAATGRRWLANARLVDGTGAPPADAAVLIEAERIAAVEDRVPPHTADTVTDLGGRTLLPGLIDVHAHVYPKLPVPDQGVEPLLPGVGAHFLAAELQRSLRMGVTTMRDVGSYGDAVVEARQAMRYGAFRGPRLLTCGRIVSPTAPGGRFFEGMYREADGPDDVRRAVREQLRRGADFVKVMTTGARTVELEDPEPAQLTEAELAVAVEEAHRLGRRVAAHVEGLGGAELAVDAGVDTVEHGMYLSQRPYLLQAMARSAQTLVPTLSCFYGIAGLGENVGDATVGASSEVTGGASPGAPRPWAPHLVELALHNLDEAARTLRAARQLGVPIAAGHDWAPLSDLGIEIARLAHHGLGAAGALVAATSSAAAALGLGAELGTVAPGRLADLIVVEGDPTADLACLRDPAAIRCVLQLGEPVAGSLVEQVGRQVAG